MICVVGAPSSFLIFLFQEDALRFLGSASGEVGEDAFERASPCTSRVGPPSMRSVQSRCAHITGIHLLGMCDGVSVQVVSKFSAAGSCRLLENHDGRSSESLADMCLITMTGKVQTQSLAAIPG